MIVLECTWSRDARLTDLSDGGCYIDTRAVPTVGDEAEVSVSLDGVPTLLRGTVVHATRGLGFALQFHHTDVDAMSRVHAFLQSHAGSDR